MLERINKFAETLRTTHLAQFESDGNYSYDNGAKSIGRNDFYIKTFNPSGYDSVYEKILDKRIWIYGDLKCDASKNQFIMSDELRDYLYGWGTTIAIFFGLPTYLSEEQLSKGKGQSLLNIFLQFIGWNRARHGWAVWKNIAAIIPFALFNFITMWPKLALNILKIVTEFLPHYLTTISAIALAYTLDAMVFASTMDKKDSFVSLALKLSIILPLSIITVTAAGAVTATSWLAYFVGHTITSPLDAMREDWKRMFGAWEAWQANSTNNRLSNDGDTTESAYRALELMKQNFAFALFSLVARTVIIAVLWGVVAVVAAPALAALVPAASIGFLSFLTPVFPALTSVLAATLQLVSTLFPVTLSAAAQATIVGAIFGTLGAALTIAAAATKKYINQFTNALHSEKEEEKILEGGVAPVVAGGSAAVAFDALEASPSSPPVAPAPVQEAVPSSSPSPASAASATSYVAPGSPGMFPAQSNDSDVVHPAVIEAMKYKVNVFKQVGMSLARLQVELERPSPLVHQWVTHWREKNKERGDDPEHFRIALDILTKEGALQSFFDAV